MNWNSWESRGGGLSGWNEIAGSHGPAGLGLCLPMRLFGDQLHVRDSFHTATHINTKYPKRTIMLGKLYFHNHSLRSRRDRLREEIFRAEELRRRAENWAGGRRFEIPRSYLAVIRRSLLSAKLCKSGGIAAKTFARATIIPPGTQATTVIAICLQFHNQLLTIAAKRQSSASATRRPI